MTAKEKAEDLYIKFYPNWLDNGLVVKTRIAKDLSLIAVDEIIYYLEIVLGVDKSEFEYWQEVKEEIELL